MGVKITHLKFIGDLVDGEESTFNLNIQVSRSVGTMGG